MQQPFDQTCCCSSLWFVPGVLMSTENPGHMFFWVFAAPSYWESYLKSLCHLCCVVAFVSPWAVGPSVSVLWVRVVNIPTSLRACPLQTSLCGSSPLATRAHPAHSVSREVRRREVDRKGWGQDWPRSPGLKLIIVVGPLSPWFLYPQVLHPWTQSTVDWKY